MLQRLVHSFLLRRHYWRHVNFDEVAELYISMLLRTMGLSLIGIFVPVFLYDIGYTIPAILVFLIWLCLSRALFDPVAGYVVARIGPKHGMLCSYLFQILALLQLLTLKAYLWPLWLIALTWGASMAFFFVSYHVNFSKVMHVDHGGKELGYMTILSRVGGIIGPLLGGVIASMFGPEYTITFAIIILVLAVVPLFLSAEPTKTHQKIEFSHINYRALWRDFASWAGSGMENSLALYIWPLFVAITVFSANSYAGIGAIAAIGMTAAIFTALAIGKLIDTKKGADLLVFSAIANAGVHLLRPFVTGFGGAALTNAVNDVATQGYALPYTKGMYSRADALPGYRIAYIVVMEVFGDLGKVVALSFTWVMTFIVSDIAALQFGFVFAAAASLLILLQRFPALKK